MHPFPHASKQRPNGAEKYIQFHIAGRSYCYIKYFNGQEFVGSVGSKEADKAKAEGYTLAYPMHLLGKR
jgi:hypothetical protein